MDAFSGSAIPGLGADTMTLEGTVNKTFVLLICLLITATPVWWLFFQDSQSIATIATFGGAIVGLIFAIATIVKPQWAPITAPLYALAQGGFLGGVSAMFEMQFQGIVIQAVGLTFAILFALLAAYKSGLIKATENFKLGVAAATGGIFLFYMVSLVVGMFGIQVPLIHSTGIFGIGFSLFVVVIASLNLVLDFDFIEHGVEQNAPKHLEWFGAFGLIVTLVWLYIEILHLLSKLRSR